MINPLENKLHFIYSWLVFLTLCLMFTACSNKPTSSNPVNNTASATTAITVITVTVGNPVSDSPIPATLTDTAIPTLLIPSLTPTPISTQTPSDTPTATCATRTGGYLYQIQVNDTLSKLAIATGTTINSIVSNNCITNPNTIIVGNRIRLPRVPDTPTPTATNTPTLTATPLAPTMASDEPDGLPNTPSPSFVPSSVIAVSTQCPATIMVNLTGFDPNNSLVTLNFNYSGGTYIQAQVSIAGDGTFTSPPVDVSTWPADTYTVTALGVTNKTSQFTLPLSCP